MTKSSIAKTRRTSSGKTRTGKKSPKNTPAKKVNSRLKPNRKHISKLWVAAGVAIIAIILTTVYFLHSLINGGVLAEQHKMAQYLKEKYGKEFVVENYRIEGGGIGVEGDPTADAYLSSKNEDIRFKVWDYGNVNEGTHQYRDDYINQRWNKEYSNEIRPKLKSILNSDVVYRVSTGLGDNEIEKIDYRTRIPSFEEYRSSKNKKYASLELVVFDAKIRDSDRLWGVISLLKETSLDDLYLRICDVNYNNCQNFDKGAIGKINSKLDTGLYIKNIMKGDDR